jgi:hypothetical protein
MNIVGDVQKIHGKLITTRGFEKLLASAQNKDRKIVGIKQGWEITLLQRVQ